MRNSEKSEENIYFCLFRQWKVSIGGNRKCRFKLLAAAESAKHALSTVHTTSVHVESLHDGLDFTYSLSRYDIMMTSSKITQS